MIVGLVVTTVALASLHLARTTLYVDTSFASFYSRQTQVSDRQSSDAMNFRGLPSRIPHAQIDTDLRERFQASIANSSDASAAQPSFHRSSGLAGRHDGKQELHVIALATAPGGDVMTGPHMRALCHLAADTMQAADEWNACLRVTPPVWTEPEWSACYEDSDCYRALPCVDEWCALQHAAATARSSDWAYC